MKRGMRTHGRFMMAAAKFKAAEAVEAAPPGDLGDQVQGDQGAPGVDVDPAIRAAVDRVIDEVIGGQ